MIQRKFSYINFKDTLSKLKIDYKHRLYSLITSQVTLDALECTENVVF